ncbi:hypothetical protein Krac_9915 [Ktedonobacter racemifer DSM 44963]|uniref:Uncharacterized protein n=1 Tax=Ktedonobacter racemifer DSM 44963 TaxID=485913 RepID=D6TE74_KTERA|nr:hypothetical protein Krac_9915 [Ktedonobacter racemifer DSM 44963]
MLLLIPLRSALRVHNDRSLSPFYVCVLEQVMQRLFSDLQDHGRALRSVLFHVNLHLKRFREEKKRDLWTFS